jgi:hypothetical protein
LNATPIILHIPATLIVVIGNFGDAHTVFHPREKTAKSEVCFSPKSLRMLAKTMLGQRLVD